MSNQHIGVKEYQKFVEVNPATLPADVYNQLNVDGDTVSQTIPKYAIITYNINEGSINPGSGGTATISHTQNITTNTTVTFTWTSGLRGVFEVGGTFGGGELVFQRQIGAHWTDFEDGLFISGGGAEFITSATNIRVVLTGATSPNLTVNIKSIVN